MESGSETCIWTLIPPELEPERMFYRAADVMGCNLTTDAEMMDCMRALIWEDLHDNATDFGKYIAAHMHTQPCTDTML